MPKLKASAGSSNFWNNLSNIASIIGVVILISTVDDADVAKQMIWAYMVSSGFYNVGNILSHINKNKPTDK